MAKPPLIANKNPAITSFIGCSFVFFGKELNWTTSDVFRGAPAVTRVRCVPRTPVDPRSLEQVAAIKLLLWVMAANANFALARMKEIAIAFSTIEHLEARRCLPPRLPQTELDENSFLDMHCR